MFIMQTYTENDVKQTCFGWVIASKSFFIHEILSFIIWFVIQYMNSFSSFLSFLSLSFSLVVPKQVHPQHGLDRPVSWPIPTHVLKTSASERVRLLARPKTRQALFEGFDPYSVSPAARAATASPRLLELSLPLPRKCKTS